MGFQTQVNQLCVNDDFNSICIASLMDRYIQAYREGRPNMIVNSSVTFKVPQESNSHFPDELVVPTYLDIRFRAIPFSKPQTDDLLQHLISPLSILHNVRGTPLELPLEYRDTPHSVRLRLHLASRRSQAPSRSNGTSC